MGLKKTVLDTLENGIGKAALGSLGGVFADQWKEFFYCDSLPDNVLLKKGQKRTSSRSANTKGEDNIISNGSVVSVANGQCMLIVEQGKIVDFTAEPGEYVYDKSTEPSLFTGKLGDTVLETFKTIGKRFTFGGDTGKDQRVYYVNTKEIPDNKFGTPNPLPFRIVVSEELNIKLTVDVKINGTYSYTIFDPIKFYTFVAGNVADEYTRDRIDSTLKAELITALQPAMAKISAMKISYDQIPEYADDVAAILNEKMVDQWGKRGFAIFTMNISTPSIPEDQRKKLEQLEDNINLTNPNMAAARLVSSQGEAMVTAAGNEAGALNGFLGMGMAMNQGGMNAGQLYQMGQQYQPQTTPTSSSANGWKCSCGATASGKFCPECGAKKPEQPSSNGWKCSCGATANGKFCPECGAKKPADDGWTCSCGAVNKGKFCPECGAKKPTGALLYRCDKCGWEPEDPKNPPKFCPECGDIFDSNDNK